jgi:C1A family cysteine protease
MKTIYGKLILPESGEIIGTGWLPPAPDIRDYTEHHEEIKVFNQKLKLNKGKLKQTAVVDLRKWCSPVENQGSLGSCSAHAGMGIVEYYEKRAFNKYTDGSRLFLYKVTRNLMQETGDSGAFLRNVMGALALCGVPDEKYWPYHVTDFDKEPSAFVYSVADNYEALKYFCHDPQGANVPSATVLDSVKKYLAAGIPSMFGFWGFPSYDSSDVKGGIPYPCDREKSEWGHAIVAVGYDDNIKIKNLKCNKVTTGALLFRNSWGTTWGDNGYGWLPYDYVLNKIAYDFWSLLGMEWVDSGQFGVE